MHLEMKLNGDAADEPVGSGVSVDLTQQLRDGVKESRKTSERQRGNKDRGWGEVTPTSSAPCILLLHSVAGHIYHRPHLFDPIVFH